MPYLTLTPTENLKLQLSPGLVASYNIQPGNGVGLFCPQPAVIFLICTPSQNYTARWHQQRVRLSCLRLVR